MNFGWTNFDAKIVSWREHGLWWGKWDLLEGPRGVTSHFRQFAIVELDEAPVMIVASKFQNFEAMVTNYLEHHSGQVTGSGKISITRDLDYKTRRNEASASVFQDAESPFPEYDPVVVTEILKNVESECEIFFFNEAGLIAHVPRLQKLNQEVMLDCAEERGVILLEHRITRELVLLSIGAGIERDHVHFDPYNDGYMDHVKYSSQDRNEWSILAIGNIKNDEDSNKSKMRLITADKSRKLYLKNWQGDQLDCRHVFKKLKWMLENRQYTLAEREIELEVSNLKEEYTTTLEPMAE